MRSFVSSVIWIMILASSSTFALTTVTSVTPAVNSENASVSTNLVIVFSDQINVSTVTSSTVMIIGATTGYRQFTKSYAAGTKTLTLTPTTAFKYGERVQVILTNGVMDGLSASIVPYSFSFTTGNSGGYGTFTESSVQSVGNTPEGIGATDLDGDGDLDLIVANYYSSNASIFSNNGSGVLTFQTTVSLGSLPQASPMAVGDFDKDGDNDVVIPCRGSGYVALLVNNSNWAFSVTNISTGGSPLGVTTGDLDADGDLDLVAPNQSDIRILLNNGSGGFSLSSTLTPGGSPHSPVLLDIDNDGDLDLGVAEYTGNSIVVYVNNGSAGFTVSNTYATGSAPRSPEYADFDRDGDLDIVVPNSGGSTVTLLTNNGSGSFSVSNINAGNIPHTASPIDLEGDGDQDLLISNGLFLVNNGSGVFTQSGASGNHEYPVIGDYDGDGDADIARVSNTQMVIRILLNSAPLSGGNTLSLNGSTALVDLPESPTMTTFGNQITIETQVRLNSLPSTNACSILNSGNQTDYSMNVNPNGTVWVRLYTPSPPATLDLTTNASLCTDRWYHLAYVYDGVTAKLYIDGNLDTMRTQSSNVGGSPQPEYIAIGACYYSGQYLYHLDGKVDELRLWNVARSAVQVNRNMYSPLGITDRSGLAGYYRFEGNFADSSGNSNHGVAVGGATRVQETITRAIELLTPNGGESWTIGTTQSITWSSSGLTTVSIDYSVDNGISWNNIASNVSASSGVYSWQIPNAPSNLCLVRVASSSCQSVFDRSDQTLSLVMPTGFVHLGIFNPSDSTLEIRTRPDVDFFGATLDSLRFTIRWLDSYNVSLGTVSSPTYSIVKYGGEQVSGAYRYQVFKVINPQTINWIANTEQVLMSVPVTQTGTGTGVVEVLNDTWTLANNGEFMVSIGGLMRTGTFYQGLASPVPFPVELVAFKGNSFGNRVYLSWRTVSETNNHGFAIQRKEKDAENWTTVGYTTGFGTTKSEHDYSYVDELVAVPTEGKLFYRLNQIDLNGSSEFSPVLEVDIVTPSEFRIEQNYPNPFVSSTQIEVFSPTACYMQIDVTDMLGNTIPVRSYGYFTAGIHTHSIDLRGYPNGMYIYTVTGYTPDKVTLFQKQRRMILAR